jgi:hypothetical protein
MSNDTSSVINNRKNNKFIKYKIINPKINITLLHNRLNNNNFNNFADKYNSNRHINEKNFSFDKNLDSKQECISLNDISLNKFSQDNLDKLSLENNYFKKIKKLNSQSKGLYSNANLFQNRVTKHLIFSSRNKSNLNKDKLKLGYNNIKSLENNVINNNRYNLKNSILTPIKIRKNIKNFESNRNYSFNSNITSARTKVDKDNSEIILPRVNSAFLEPKLYPFNIDLDREREKLIINQNLRKLLDRIKKKIMPKKKVILSPNKLPTLVNKKLKENQNSCIHRLEYGNSIVFVKTHLDGLDNEKKLNEKKMPNISRKYEINEGYVDLNVLNSGNNISFKTNLIEKDGLYFYEFNKYGRMETVEEKVHRVKKDKKEFKKLLEIYQKNEVFKHMENQNFEIIKKKYKEKPIINKNIYRDLFHMLYKK